MISPWGTKHAIHNVNGMKRLLLVIISLYVKMDPFNDPFCVYFFYIPNDNAVLPGTISCECVPIDQQIAD